MIKVYKVYNKYTGVVMKETLSETEAIYEQDKLNYGSEWYNVPWLVSSRFMDDSYRSIFED